MSTVRSTWTAPIDVTLGFTPATWAGAGQLPLPVGSMLVKNDSQFVYVALDLTGDTGNSPGVGDYFWLTFDVDRNRSITPHLDVNYGTYPDLPIKIGHQFYLGPNTWTGLQPAPSLALSMGPARAPLPPRRIASGRSAYPCPRSASISRARLKLCLSACAWRQPRRHLRTIRRLDSGATSPICTIWSSRWDRTIRSADWQA